MSVKRPTFSKGAQKILQLIKDASAEGGVMRWQGLRLLGLEPAGQKLYIPLDNDGNLIQQFTGLERWCQHFASEFGFRKHEASLMALAYVARQLNHENQLLNNQTVETSQADGENLEKIRGACFGYGKKSKADTTSSDIFHLVACVLTTKSDPQHQQGLSTEYMQKIKAAGNLLEKANAAHYMKTGVSAIMWARTYAKSWSKLTATRKKDQKNIKQEAMRTAELLAANAYGNNANKLDAKTIWDILASLEDSERVMIGNPDAYIYSRNLAAAAQPSRDSITQAAKLQK